MEKCVVLKRVYIRDHPFSTYAKLSKKNDNFIVPDTHTHTYAYEGVITSIFSENVAYVLNG